MRHIFVLVLLACLCALGSALVAFADTSVVTPDPETTTQTQLTPPEAQALVDRYRRRTWHWQRVMGRPVQPALRDAPADPLTRIRVWRQIAAHTQQVAQHPPHARAWACIHRYEGSWQDPNAPYYGGLQMDLGFQRTYGRWLLVRKGTAEHWTPLEQMWVAEKAFRSGRGFSPWPNTARYCGLL